MNTNAKKILKMGLLFSLSLFIVLYTFFISKDLLFGVEIKNVNFDGQRVDDMRVMAESVVAVFGNAKNAIHLRLNGRPIFMDQAGNWQETIALLPGYNVVEIKAEDKFGNREVKNYQLILK